MRKAFSGRHVHVKTDRPRACASTTTRGRFSAGTTELPAWPSALDASSIRLCTLMPSTAPTRRSRPSSSAKEAKVGAADPSRATRSAGLPDASSSSTDAAASPRSWRSVSTVGSKDSTVSGGVPSVHPAAASSATTREATSHPSEAKYVACLISSTTPTRPPPRSRTRSSTFRRHSTGSPSSCAALSGRRSGRRSRQRRVDSSSQTKSSTNQPVHATPSIVLVVRRSANSGRSATSVVPEISFSCRTTSTPSRETTTSGSTASTPWASASSYDDRECSGR